MVFPEKRNRSFRTGKVGRKKKTSAKLIKTKPNGKRSSTLSPREKKGGGGKGRARGVRRQVTNRGRQHLTRGKKAPWVTRFIEEGKEEGKKMRSFRTRGKKRGEKRKTQRDDLLSLSYQRELNGSFNQIGEKGKKGGEEEEGRSASICQGLASTGKKRKRKTRKGKGGGESLGINGSSSRTIGGEKNKGKKEKGGRGGAPRLAAAITLFFCWGGGRGGKGEKEGEWNLTRPERKCAHRHPFRGGGV